MICIDTEALRDAVEAARSASENISYAVEKLQSVTTHDDWVCSNRDKINEYILNFEPPGISRRLFSFSFVQTGQFCQGG